MSNFVIPKNYKSELNLYETQIAIKTVKDFFQTLLAERLHLLRVSAPLFVAPESGLNDNLNGVERPVTFDIKCQADREAEIVQSLAKWKRYALKKYGFSHGEGLYTDMVAIRRDPAADGYVPQVELLDLTVVANTEKKFPLEWITEDGAGIRREFFDYALPLIAGENPYAWEQSLPRFANLKKILAD